MNKDDPKVAELLLQLEELKRKKAQKLLKLQKLGRRSGKLSLSGSNVESNSEALSNKTNTHPVCSQENKVKDEKDIRKKCTKCNSKLKKDQNCSICNSSKGASDTAKTSKFTLPLHPSNSENHSKTHETVSKPASFKLLKSFEDSESILDSCERTAHESKTDIASVSQISTFSVAEKSLHLQASPNFKSNGKDSVNEKEILSSIDKRQSSATETISNCVSFSKLQSCTSVFPELCDKESKEYKLGHTFHVKEDSVNSNEKHEGLSISTCYETNIQEGFSDCLSKQRKRSSSISEKEAMYECEAKKMRISDNLKTAAEENDLFNESIFEDHCNGNSTKAKKDSAEEHANFLQEKSFTKGSETKSEDISSNISDLLSGSFTVHENDENLNTDSALNPASECVDINVKNVETFAGTLNKDDLGKNCSVSPSMRLSSPFSDELAFSIAVESSPDVSKKQFPLHDSVDNTSCDSKEVHEFAAKHEFKNVILDDSLNEKPSVSERGAFCEVPNFTLDSDVLEFTEDLVAEVNSMHDPDDVEENLTPALLDSPANANFQAANVHEKSERSDIKPDCEKNSYHASSLNQPRIELDCDAQTADLDLDSDSTSLVAFEEDSIPERTSNAHEDNFLFKVPEAPKFLSETINAELSIPDSEVFTIPETEMLAPMEEHINHDEHRTSVSSVAKCDHTSDLRVIKSDFIGSEDTENISESCAQSKFSDPFEDTDFLDDSFSESLAKIEQYDEFQDTLMVEDTLELGNFKNIPFLSDDEYSVDKSNEEAEFEDDNSSNIKFSYCVHSEVQEPVTDLKIVLFNGCRYTFIKFKKCIIVCRLEGKSWNKIFCHEIEETFELNEICFTKNDTFLVLVMLLKSDQGNCLQFVLFEKDTKVIKLMEQTHWLQNSDSGDSVLLCGLDSLKFSTALGGDFFEVFVHAFSCLDSSPRLLSAPLGNLVEGLHSLCPVENLPNAMIGLSSSKLFVWHLLETRLVTSVCLQPEDVLPIEKCFWAIIENGLIYFLTLCGDLDSSYACQLFVANLATGFCRLASPYNVIPATETKLLKKRNMCAAYSQPFLVASGSNGSFLWSIDDEYCSASLDKGVNASSIAITSLKENCHLIAIGTNEGIVNFYNFRCS